MRILLSSMAGAIMLAFATPAVADITAEEAIAIAREHGMETVEEVDRDDGKWEVEGRDADGRELEIDIDIATGEVLKIERD